MINQKNFNFSTDVNTKIRPKRVYLTSDNIDDYITSSRTNYILQENITAEEGFNLAFGISSLGFTATAHNISQRQENNKLSIILNYKNPIWIPNGAPNNAGEYEYTKNPVVWNTTFDNIKTDEPILTEEFVINIPDGYYTLQTLFDYLNSQLNVFLPSKLKQNIHKATNIKESVNNRNDIAIQLFFYETVVGFTIDLVMGNNRTTDSSSSPQENIKNFYKDKAISTLLVNKGLEAYHVNYRLHKIEIKPTKDFPALYNLLFTNKSSTKYISPACPSFINIHEINNPPTSIVFYTDNLLSSTKAANDVNPFVDKDEVELTINDPNSTLLYYVELLPTNDLLDNIYIQSDKLIPANFYNYPLTIYFKPILNPIYVDVITDLETNNFSDVGSAKNILIKQFVPGNTNGVTDFYEKYTNPIWHTTLRQNINAISLSFVSQDNKWDFFNLSFVLELIIFEYPESNEISELVEEVFNIPNADPTTSYLNQYLGTPSNPYQVVTEPNFTPLPNLKLKRKR